MNSEHEPAFNLLDEPWIPCRDGPDRLVKLGLLNVFEQADRLRELRASTPLLNVALLRVLLAVLYRVCPPKGIDAWGKLWRDGLPCDRIRDYLEKWRDRFFLFHSKHAFFQDPDLEGDSPSPVSKLCPEAATGNNRQLADHSSDADPTPVSFADAALLLLGAQSWGIAGLAGPGRQNFTHAPCVGGISVLGWGRSLRETLLLNLCIPEHLTTAPRRIPVGDRHDVPVWELDPSAEDAWSLPRGMCDYLTWRARSVRLVPDGESVSQVHLVQARALDVTSVVNPWAPARKDEKRGWVVTRASEDKAMWRDAQALLAATLSGQGGGGTQAQLRSIGAIMAGEAEAAGLLQGSGLDIVAIGLANDKAKLLLWREERFALPLRLLGREFELESKLQRATKLAEDAADALRDALTSFCMKLMEAGSKSADKDAARKLRDSLSRIADYWAALEGPFHAYLARLGDDPESATTLWADELARTARGAFDASLRSIENSGRAWRARVAAERIFNSRLNSLIPKEESNDLVSTAVSAEA